MLKCVGFGVNRFGDQRGEERFTGAHNLNFFSFRVFSRTYFSNLSCWTRKKHHAKHPFPMLAPLSSLEKLKFLQPLESSHFSLISYQMQHFHFLSSLQIPRPPQVNEALKYCILGEGRYFSWLSKWIMFLGELSGVLGQLYFPFFCWNYFSI